MNLTPEEKERAQAFLHSPQAKDIPQENKALYAKAWGISMEKVTLDTMTDDEFDAFFDALPPHVKMLAKGGLVSWQFVIDEYYYKTI